MLTGMPSILIERSVPWSRLKPRRKYWLALPSPECWVTIRPGTASSASPGREKGTAFTSAPLMRMALAAVGCSVAAPSEDSPGVTPLAPDVTGWLVCGVVLFRAVRLCDCFGRAARFGFAASGAVTVTGGRWLCGTGMSCAAAGYAQAADEAAAENIRNKTLRTDMPPHVTCYSP